jgi:hypothetical protein
MPKGLFFSDVFLVTLTFYSQTCTVGRPKKRRVEDEDEFDSPQSIDIGEDSNLGDGMLFCVLFSILFRSDPTCRQTTGSCVQQRNTRRIRCEGLSFVDEVEGRSLVTTIVGCT